MTADAAQCMRLWTGRRAAFRKDRFVMRSAAEKAVYRFYPWR